MTTIDHAQRYMDILAVGLQIVGSFTDEFNMIYAIRDYENITENVKKQLSSFWENDNDRFLDKAETLLRIILGEENESRRIVMAFAFCDYMDSRLTYLRQEENDKGERIYFSLHCMVPVLNNKCVEIGALNKNWEETGIWINPKFSISFPHVVINGENTEKRISNRDIFEGMNGILQNCSYVLWNNKCNVKNIIIAKEFSEKSSKFIIAFAPMSDKKNLIETMDLPYVLKGRSMLGEVVEPVKNEDELVERLESDWMLAGDEEADVFFAPELLGTSLSEMKNGNYNKLIYKKSMCRLAMGESVPKLTVMPSYWHEQHNKTSIVGQSGKILAYQEKYIPFVDKKIIK